MTEEENYAELIAHFSDPERYARITGAPDFNPRKAIWLTDDNIRAMARNEEFMKTFRSIK